ncbi:MAG: hypothetical protein IVW56_07785 [Candidatus Binataceae bacterium]|nr:hypothetical protein [Candidatus Binataceae bacterium]
MIIDGGHFSRAGLPFPLRAMRLPGVSGTLDFSAKLALLQRLRELKAAHTTALILSDAQAEPVLALAGQAGLAAIVEIAVAADELKRPGAYRQLLSRAAQTANVLRGHPGLIGYLIELPRDAACPPPDGAALPRDDARRMRRRLRELIATIRGGDDRPPVAVRHRAGTLALASAGEDFIYLQLENIALAEFALVAATIRRIAVERPLVVEFGEGLPGQAELVAHAFGIGAAGVVAAVMRPAAAPKWLGWRRTGAGELLPFAALAVANAAATDDPGAQAGDRGAQDGSDHATIMTLPAAPSADYRELIAALNARPTNNCNAAVERIAGAAGRAWSGAAERIAIAGRRIASGVRGRVIAHLHPHAAGR